MPNLALRTFFQNQSGYMWYFLIVGLVAVTLFFVKGTYSPPPTETSVATTQYCQDILYDPNQTIEGPAYSTTAIDLTQTRRYKLVKKMVPIPTYFFVATPAHHFFQEFSKNIEDPITHRKYLMKIPNGENGRSYNVPTVDGTYNYFTFADVGLIYMFYLTNDGQPLVVDHFTRVDGVEQSVSLADLYIAEDKTLPDWVLKCQDAGEKGQTDNIVYERNGLFSPPQNVSPDRKELQLEYFLLQKYKLLLQAWWTPHCKPAIYLYPPKQELVNVKVEPNGFLTYTDPPYNSATGWNVWAEPHGDLRTQNAEYGIKNYNYLYFESKIEDRLISKPTKGWVIAYNDLSNFYKSILPQLNFNQQQQKDFIEYWTKNLPQSSYYFISLIDPKEVDTYETLSITPKPDSIMRIRFYFEGRDQMTNVPPLDLSPWKTISLSTTQFRVFEWGGMLKRDKDHPYTCSM